MHAYIYIYIYIYICVCVCVCVRARARAHACVYMCEGMVFDSIREMCGLKYTFNSLIFSEQTLHL